MGKDLSEMTLEELWDLFTIFLVAHDDRWNDSFHEIEKTLTRTFSRSACYPDQPYRKHRHSGDMDQEYRFYLQMYGRSTKEIWRTILTYSRSLNFFR